MSTSRHKFFIVNLGKCSYGKVLALQESLFRHKLAVQKHVKGDSCKGGFSTLEREKLYPDIVLLVEHDPPVYTVGRRNLPASHFLTADASMRYPSEYSKVDTPETVARYGLSPYLKWEHEHQQLQQKALDRSTQENAFLNSFGEDNNIHNIEPSNNNNEITIINNTSTSVCANGTVHTQNNDSPSLDLTSSLPVHAGIDVVRIARGGGITWHGPGQLVMYPIINVRELWRQNLCVDKGRSPLRWYTHVLEQSCVNLLNKSYGLDSYANLTGVWSKRGDGQPGKVVSIGLQLSDWVSMHGMALNVSCITKYFEQVVVCELPGAKATTIAELLKDKRKIKREEINNLRGGAEESERVINKKIINKETDENEQLSLSSPSLERNEECCSLELDDVARMLSDSFLEQLMIPGLKEEICTIDLKKIANKGKGGVMRSVPIQEEKVLDPVTFEELLKEHSAFI